MSINQLPVPKVQSHIDDTPYVIFSHNQMGNDIHCALPELTLPFQWCVGHLVREPIWLEDIKAYKIILTG